MIPKHILLMRFNISNDRYIVDHRKRHTGAMSSFVEQGQLRSAIELSRCRFDVSIQAKRFHSTVLDNLVFFQNDYVFWNLLAKIDIF